MNIQATDFSPSNATHRHLQTIDLGILSAYLTTDGQIADAYSILEEWNQASTLSALMMQWLAKNEIPRTSQSHFSLLLYNINSFHAHLEDLICYVCSSYPTIWALAGLHFNELANYQLASFFKSRCTIYYQQGTNRFGGVCLAIAREVPHRLVP